MALLVPNEGEREMLARILNVKNDRCRIHLYCQPKDPEEEDTAATFNAIEIGTAVVSQGYASILLEGADWVSKTLPNGETEATLYPIVFEFSGNIDVYGYYVTNANSTILLWAERFTDGPYKITPSGGKVTVLPRVRLD